MNHIILLGDSVFDNAAYVGGGPAVIDHLKEFLRTDEGDATLLAVDGDVVNDVKDQCENLPRDATYLVVSIGGNDALGNLGFLGEKAASVAEVLNRLSDIGHHFRKEYVSMLEHILQFKMPTVVSTIYYGNFPDGEERRLTRAALSTFNDIILVEAFKRAVPVIDMRLVCSQPADYANPIEPSVQGGKKIAKAILNTITNLHVPSRRSVVFTS